MNMKNFLVFILSILFSITLSAQSDRKFNNWVIHANFTFNKLSMDANVYDYKKSKGGLSIDVGAKQFFIKNCGWFMEEAFEFFHSDLPHATMQYNYTNHKASIWTWGCEILQETGVGGIVLTGYDFRLNNSLSFEVFGGFNYRRITKYKETRWHPDRTKKISAKYHVLAKNDQKWKFGMGFNYKKINIRCSIMPTKRETRVKRNGWQAPPAPQWTTTQWTFGVGYHF